MRAPCCWGALFFLQAWGAEEMTKISNLVGDYMPQRAVNGKR